VDELVQQMQQMASDSNGNGNGDNDGNRVDSKPDCIVLSVGGGGLLVGVQQGLKRNGWADVQVLAVETEGAASFAAAKNAGEVI
jgi:threonine dehydratase